MVAIPRSFATRSISLRAIGRMKSGILSSRFSASGVQVIPLLESLLESSITCKCDRLVPLLSGIGLDTALDHRFHKRGKTIEFFLRIGRPGEIRVVAAPAVPGLPPEVSPISATMAEKGQPPLDFSPGVAEVGAAVGSRRLTTLDLSHSNMPSSDQSLRLLRLSACLASFRKAQPQRCARPVSRRGN